MFFLEAPVEIPLPPMNVHSADYIVLIIYMLGVLFCGTWFGRNTKSTSEFFFGGHRFSWWLVGISCIATLIGSYSFIFYSERGYTNGLSAAMNYTMDWYVLPLFLLIWLPIIYFTRIKSIPEYFERRFDAKTRMAALVTIMVYLIGYIGVNLYTIGDVLKGMLGWNLYFAAFVVLAICAGYMYKGGQNSMIMTDLFQAGLLVGAGIIIFILGVNQLGGWSNFWNNFPVSHRLPFASFNTPTEYHTVGIFWDDAITGTIAFYCMNQGILMRFMSTRSVREGSKAMLGVLFLLMPLAAISVCSAGWVGKAMETAGLIKDPFMPRHVFVVITNAICSPGVFGFMMAALFAAMISTLDTYISAFSAITVNDIWKPFIVRNKDDKYYLKVARIVAVGAGAFGFVLIPFYASFASVAQAFSHFCSAVTPPMIVVIVLGAVWKRYTPNAAFSTLVFGFIINVTSLFIPAMITPIAHGEDPAGGHTYMRAFFGIVVSVTISLVVTLFSKPKPQSELAGLVACTVKEGMRQYKGGEPDEVNAGRKVSHLSLKVMEKEPEHKQKYKFGQKNQQRLQGHNIVHLSEAKMQELHAQEGDLLYIADQRFWLGGLRSIHAKAGEPHQDGDMNLYLTADAAEQGDLLLDRPVMVEKIL